MDPETIAAVVGVGGKLLSGLGAKSAGRVTNDNIRNLAAGARKWGEAYGFNPLTLLGASAGMAGQAAGPTVGQSIADAALMGADVLLDHAKDKAEIAALREANDELIGRVRDSTLRPVVPSPVFGPGGISLDGPGFRLRTGMSNDGVVTPLVDLPTELSMGEVVTAGVPLLSEGGGLYDNGVLISAGPGQSSAQTAQNEFGNMAEEYYGVTNWLGGTVNASRRITDADGWTTPGVNYGNRMLNYLVPPSLGWKFDEYGPAFSTVYYIPGRKLPDKALSVPPDFSNAMQ